MEIGSFEREVWAAALQLFEQFGSAAEAEVSELIQQADSAHDREAAVIWGSVLRALTAIRESDSLLAI